LVVSQSLNLPVIRLIFAKEIVAKNVFLFHHFPIAGRVTITLETSWYKPLDGTSSSDQEAADQSLEFNVSCSELCKISPGPHFLTL